MRICTFCQEIPSRSPWLSPQFIVTFLLTLLSLLQIDVTSRWKVGLLWFFDKVIEGVDSSVGALLFFAHCQFFACCRRSSLAVIVLCSILVGHSFFALCRYSSLFRHSSLLAVIWAFDLTCSSVPGPWFFAHSCVSSLLVSGLWFFAQWHHSLLKFVGRWTKLNRWSACWSLASLPCNLGSWGAPSWPSIILDLKWSSWVW